MKLERSDLGSFIDGIGNYFMRDLAGRWFTITTPLNKFEPLETAYSELLEREADDRKEQSPDLCGFSSVEELEEGYKMLVELAGKQSEHIIRQNEQLADKGHEYAKLKLAYDAAANLKINSTITLRDHNAGLAMQSLVLAEFGHNHKLEEMVEEAYAIYRLLAGIRLFYFSNKIGGIQG